MKRQRRCQFAWGRVLMCARSGHTKRFCRYDPDLEHACVGALRLLPTHKAIASGHASIFLVQPPTSNKCVSAQMTTLRLHRGCLQKKATHMLVYVG